MPCCWFRYEIDGKLSAGERNKSTTTKHSAHTPLLSQNHTNGSPRTQCFTLSSLSPWIVSWRWLLTSRPHTLQVISGSGTCCPGSCCRPSPRCTGPGSSCRPSTRSCSDRTRCSTPGASAGSLCSPTVGARPRHSDHGQRRQCRDCE